MRAADPTLDAWKGMAAFTRTAEFRKVGVSKAEYDEYGGERVRRWWGGNWNGEFSGEMGDEMQVDEPEKSPKFSDHWED
jgi:actin-related protein 5